MRTRVIFFSPDGFVINRAKGKNISSDYFCKEGRVLNLDDHRLLQVALLFFFIFN